jgi:hypothetical protein
MTRNVVTRSLLVLMGLLMVGTALAAAPAGTAASAVPAMRSPMSAKSDRATTFRVMSPVCLTTPSITSNY